MSDTRDQRLLVSNPPDLLAVIPYLLGFHPSESIVALLLDQGVVKVSARWDICQSSLTDDVSSATPSGVKTLCGQLTRLLSRYPRLEYVLVAYSRDAQRAKDALRAASFASETRPVFAMAYDGARWWADNSLDAPGVPMPSGTSAITAAAVFHGLGALPAREQLEAVYEPASAVGTEGSEPQRMTSDCGSDCAMGGEVRAKLRRSLRRLTPGDQIAELDAVMLAGPSANPEALVRAGLIVGQEQAWVHAWRSLAPEDARAGQALWLAVLRQTLPADSGPVYGLLGIACWLAGDGAAASICLDKGRQQTRLSVEARSTEQPATDWQALDVLALLIDEAVPPTSTALRCGHA